MPALYSTDSVFISTGFWIIEKIQGNKHPDGFPNAPL